MVVGVPLRFDDSRFPPAGGGEALWDSGVCGGTIVELRWSKIQDIALYLQSSACNSTILLDIIAIDYVEKVLLQKALLVGKARVAVYV
jgi:hypothetical protein